MQRVAEDYARIRFPKRFPRFDFRAFSEEGKSRPGWPDAWVDVDGQIDGVEATGSKDKSAVLRHLDEDLKKARARSPRLAGLLLVSGHPAVQPTADELEAWRQRFITEAGLAPDRIHLVFGAGLVAELVQPEFARTRIEVLGMEYAPSHFKLVRAKRGPDEGRIDSALVPSEEDYEAGRVHRPAAANQVWAQLHRHRCALVRGVGASGKSVLAWLLGLEVAGQRRPAYLLDLADYVDASPDTASALIEDLHRFCHPEALFILDNCHLEESLAKEIVIAWQDLVPGEQPRLLLLGRELHTSRGSLIDGLQIEPLALTARQPEVRGVYMRLARRRMGGQPPPEPPQEVLDRWVGTFGGDPSLLDTTTDLIAFSAAVWGRMRDLLHGRWALSEADAIHEVRSVYLDKLSEAETRNLMQLSVVQELDLSIDEAALTNPSAGFHKCGRRLGLVFRQKVGAAGQYVKYRLAHAALGRLILRASHVELDPAAERLGVARKHPYFAVNIFDRLLTLERVAEARALATDMFTRPNLVLELGGLQRVEWLMRRVQKAGMILPPIGALVSAEPARRALVERALQTPLHLLANFLSYAARTTELKPVFAALTADLALSANRQTLAERAMQTPLSDLANFLGYAARTAELKPVFAALTADLALSANRQTLAERTMQTPLNHLPNFLSYAARTTELEPVVAALTTHLALPANRRAIVELALQTPLHFLANFLSYAARTTEFKPVFAALTSDLALPANRQTVAERALQTPLHFLANFLGFAARTTELKPVFAALTADLALPANRLTLGERALQAPLDHLARFLDYAARTTELKPLYAALTADLALPDRRPRIARSFETAPLGSVVAVLRLEDESGSWAAAFADVDSGRWGDARRKEELPNVDAFVAFQRIAAKLGRPELAEVPALRLVSGSTPEEWHRPGIGLHHFSHVLRLARGASPAELDGLLDRVATPDWLDEQLAYASTGGLAGSLLALVTILQPAQLRRFHRDALVRRVARELSWQEGPEAESLAAALSLLGASRGIGLTGALREAHWASARGLAEALHRRAPDPDRTTVGPLQIQLWLGLREMARWRADVASVPPDVADRILELWQASERDDAGLDLPPHVRTLNAGMIAWLKCCRAAGWRLVPPEGESTAGAQPTEV